MRSLFKSVQIKPFYVIQSFACKIQSEERYETSKRLCYTESKQSFATLRYNSDIALQVYIKWYGKSPKKLSKKLGLQKLQNKPAKLKPKLNLANKMLS